MIARSVTGDDTGRPGIRSRRVHVALAVAVAVAVAAFISIAPPVADGKLPPNGPLVYHQGPVLAQPTTTYFIYWRGRSGTLPAAYIQDFASFVGDWSGSSAHGVLTQYYQVDHGKQFVSDAVSYGGTTTDASPFPRDTLSDGQIAREVRAAVTREHLPEGIRVNYAVLLPEQVQTNTRCAWHAWVPDPRSGQSIYFSAIPYYNPNSHYTRATGCYVHRGGPYPHGEATDNGIDMLSHELSEVATDPSQTHGTRAQLGRGWRMNADAPADQLEIGDICRWRYGAGDPLTGANAFLNGHPYLIQEEFSNENHGCSLGHDLIRFCGTVGSSVGAGDAGIRAYGIDCVTARHVIDTGAPGWVHRQYRTFERWTRGNAWITGRPLGD